jgi:hypothetical protein
MSPLLSGKKPWRCSNLRAKPLRLISLSRFACYPLSLRAAYERRGLLDRRHYSSPPVDQFITGFPAGHSWTNNGLATFRANTAQYVFRDRSLLIGAKDVAYTQRGGLSLDLAGRDVRLWL